MKRITHKQSTSRNFTLKLFFPSKVDRYETKSIRRFLNYVRTINWSNDLKKIYLRISYGKYKDSFGKLTTFYNDGWYFDQPDFNLALKAFLEE